MDGLNENQNIDIDVKIEVIPTYWKKRSLSHTVNY